MQLIMTCIIIDDLWQTHYTNMYYLYLIFIHDNLSKHIFISNHYKKNIYLPKLVFIIIHNFLTKMHFREILFYSVFSFEQM